MKIHMRRERKKKGLSLNELSKKSHVALSYLSDIENGKRENVSVKKLCRVAKVLGITLSELVDCEEEGC